MREESNAALDKCMSDWEDLSAEYLVIIFYYEIWTFKLTFKVIKHEKTHTNIGYFDNDFQDLEELHKTYRMKLEEALSLQKKVSSGVKHQRYVKRASNVFLWNLKLFFEYLVHCYNWINSIEVLIFRYRLGAIQKMMSDVNGTTNDEQLQHKNDLSKDILRRKAQLTQVLYWFYWFDANSRDT